MTVRIAGVCDCLRAVLDRTAFGEALHRVARISMPDDVGALNHAPAVERLRAEKDPAAVLTRLFYLETVETVAALRRVLSTAELSLLVAAGLLRRVSGGIRTRLRLDVVQGKLILADRRFETPDRGALGLPRGDMVYPPGADSAMLAEVVAGIGGDLVLDVCTGSGLQGLVAAESAQRVWVSDISPRAAAMASVNARLNHVERLTPFVGNLFKPFGRERFDLLIANPPFVPGPQRGPAYHSGGPRGDRVLRRILAAMGDHLRPRGRAVMISHLALRAGETPDKALASAVRRFHGRILILTLDSGTPIDLAAAQSIFALERGLRSYAREVGNWVAYLRRHDVDRIVALLLVAEAHGRHQVDLVDASPRTLPIPLSRPPRDHVGDWLKGS